jgi:hypothetical protein
MSINPTPFAIDLTPAFFAFLNTLEAAQQRGESEASLTVLRDKSLSRLDQQWETLEQLAQEGLEADIAAPLDVFLREWAIKEALDLLLRYPTVYIDPTLPRLQSDFWDKLARQHQALASGLLLFLRQGQRQRDQAKAQQQPDRWETFAADMMQQQHRQQLDWQQAAYQTLQEQRRSLDEQRQAMFTDHEVAQRWSRVALDGMDQAQRGVEQSYQLVSDLHGDVREMITSTHQYQQQVLPETVRQATELALRQRGRARLLIVLIILLAIPALLALCFFLLTHLY